jgi:hypothetical protein
LQFWSEFYNIWNHPQFKPPNINFAALSVGCPLSPCGFHFSQIAFPAPVAQGWRAFEYSEPVDMLAGFVQFLSRQGEES